MNAAPDRRAVLGSILTAGACLSPPLWAGADALVADPVLAAIERHRRAYDAFMQVWGKTSVLALYDRAKADEDAAAELRRFRELETEEEVAFSALLATRPATKASANRLRQARRRLRLGVGRNAGLARDDGGIAAGVVNEVNLSYAAGRLRQPPFCRLESGP
jgi:hypothetical protein